MCGKFTFHIHMICGMGTFRKWNSECELSAMWYNCKECGHNLAILRISLQNSNINQMCPCYGRKLQIQSPLAKKCKKCNTFSFKHNYDNYAKTMLEFWLLGI